MDMQKLKVQVLFNKGDRMACINMLLSIIRENYSDPESQFISIFDMHELLISLLTLESQSYPSYTSQSIAFEEEKTATIQLPTMISSFKHFEDY